MKMPREILTVLRGRPMDVDDRKSRGLCTALPCGLFSMKSREMGIEVIAEDMNK